VDEAFEFDTIWAPLGDADDAAAMDDDEWFQQVHDGHEKVAAICCLCLRFPVFYFRAAGVGGGAA
jgi:hypothetical protein